MGEERALVAACDGVALRGAFDAAAVLLERHAEAINALNVFPVPDGDTGKNMLLTMRAALDATRDEPLLSAGQFAARLARGALMGSRGNSGVILSQILRGFARGLGDATTIDGSLLAAAAREAATTAYRAVQQPVEGTMLTVIREAAEGAERVATVGGDVRAILDAALQAARVALARTPELLPRLREAGVVDAGGQGIVTLLDGAARFLRGEPLPDRVTGIAAPGAAMADFLAAHEEDEVGYCTNLLLLARPGARFDYPTIRGRLLALGESGVVTGDEEVVKVHIHTEHPGVVLEEALRWGEVTEIRIDNMAAQVRDVSARRPATPTPPEAATALAGPQIVAVASGDGLIETLRGLGAAAIVTGGQTMNPSTAELLRAVEALSGDEVIILPNNENVILTAEQVAPLTAKRIAVVPSRSVPQGIAALAAVNFDVGFAANVAAMTAALANVRTGELTTAVRAVTLDGVAVRAGETIGLLDGALCCAGAEATAVLFDLLDRMGAAAAELITLYRGAGVDEAAGQRVVELVQSRYPDATVELVNGGQPHYAYLVSVE